MKTKICSAQRGQVAKQLAVLPKLTVAELKERWRSFYETNPPPRIGRGLLTRAIAYRLQEQAFGGLKPSTRRLLKRLAATADAGQPLNLAPTPSAGTVLGNLCTS
jgi:hypothetical protein